MVSINECKAGGIKETPIVIIGVIIDIFFVIIVVVIILPISYERDFNLLTFSSFPLAIVSSTTL